MAIDLIDETPAPQPAPKKSFRLGEASDPNDPGARLISWPAGVTLGSVLSSEFPAALRNRVNAFNAVLEVSIRVREV